MEKIRTDFLVIGSGIAGLSYAIKTATSLPGKRITILCKSEPKETNTRYAQGGIAVSDSTLFDSPEKHISDTLKAGDGLCDKQIVEMVVKEGPQRLKELINKGVKFDKNGVGYDLAMEGGHSTNRIYHRGDYTGLEVERKLLAKARKLKNITIIDHSSAIDLIVDKHLPVYEKSKKNTCYGAFVLLEKQKKIVAVVSGITILATGGIGQIFEHTTNSIVASGDGIAMAQRAGAEIRNMAFVQFHPTALFEINAERDFLITEALRGFGAILRNANGEAFMREYDPAGDLATRDLVARAIKKEMAKTTCQFVYLDCRHIPKKEIRKHFPTILARCLTLNINPSKHLIPVVPSAHYCCGGIATDKNGKTTINNLYACGECAETGLHGANRLASNSLLEALVFAHRCSVHSEKKIASCKTPKTVADQLINYLPEQASPETSEQTRKIKSIMSESYCVLTSNKKIEKGLEALNRLRKQIMCQRQGNINFSIISVINLLKTAQLVLEDAKKRTKNTGVFCNTDLTVSTPDPQPAGALFKTDKSLVSL